MLPMTIITWLPGLSAHVKCSQQAKRCTITNGREALEEAGCPSYLPRGMSCKPWRVTLRLRLRRRQRHSWHSWWKSPLSRYQVGSNKVVGTEIRCPIDIERAYEMVWWTVRVRFGVQYGDSDLQLGVRADTWFTTVIDESSNIGLATSPFLKQAVNRRTGKTVWTLTDEKKQDSCSL